jgi:hypothetical protein
MELTSFRSAPSRAAAYARFQASVYAGDANWVPPVRSHLLAQLAPDHPFVKRPGSAVRHFVASNGGEMLGHASAIVSPALRDRDGTPIGAVGFFDCVDDADVARALFAAAFDWLRSRHGIRRVWAPVNFDIWHGYRLMVRGFDEPTFFGEPYNPAYYPPLFEASGLAVRARWRSLEIADRGALAELCAPWRRNYEAALADGCRLTPLDVRDNKELQLLHVLVEDSFRAFLGLASIPFEDFRDVFSGYASVVGERLASLIRDRSGAAVGFSLGYPDLAAALRAMRGGSGPLARLRFRLAGRAVQRVVYFMLGVTRRAQATHQGLGRAAAWHFLHTVLEGGYRSVIFALIAEGGPAERLFGDRMAQAQRAYALYEADL